MEYHQQGESYLQYHVLTEDAEHRYNRQDEEEITVGLWRTKTLFLLILVIPYFLYRALFVDYPPSNCIYDWFHEHTLGLNRLIASDPYDIVILINQYIMDITVLGLLIYWSIFVHNTRLFASMVIFYSVRSLLLVQNYSYRYFVDRFPFPQWLYWIGPNFPSLTVPYDHTRDFYFSGHTGAVGLFALEMFLLRLPLPVLILSLLTSLYIVLSLIVLYVHYTIDILGGIIFALWSAKLAKQYVKYSDYFWSSPLILGQLIYQCIRTCAQ